MNGFLVKLLVLGISLLSALPSSLCCADLFGSVEHQAPAASHCCPHSPQSDQPNPRPLQPTADCCCDHDATLAPRISVPPVDEGLPLAVVSVAPTVTSGAADGLRGDTILDSSPPLYVLQCV